MIDQAHKLRALVGEVGPAVDVDAGALPMIVVAGSRAAVGASTVALNLAAVLADRGESVLMIDGGQHRNDLRELAGMRRDIHHGLSDVLAGKCDVRDAIVPGPAGVQMLFGQSRDASKSEFASRRDATTWGDSSRGAQQRCMCELQSLSEAFDLLVVDAGHGDSPWTQRLWSRAKLVVMVTTTVDAAVLDCYATIKKHSAGTATQAVRLLVNQVASNLEARHTHARIENACQEFLSRSLPALPAMPRHRADQFVDFSAPPRVWEMPNSPFGHAALWLGRAVSEAMTGEDAGCEEQGSESESFPASGIPHPASL